MLDSNEYLDLKIDISLEILTTILTHPDIDVSSDEWARIAVRQAENLIDLCIVGEICSLKPTKRASIRNINDRDKK